MRSDLVRFVDVHDPLRNVLDEYMAPPEINTTIDFGLAKDNSMFGAWRVLSLERVYVYSAMEPQTHLRANVQRVA